TSGYRGEGSPDHADALVFAITDLLLNEPAAIIEFYRVRAEAGRAMPAEPAARAGELPIRLLAPEGISGAHAPGMPRPAFARAPLRTLPDRLTDLRVRYRRPTRRGAFPLTAAQAGR